METSEELMELQRLAISKAHAELSIPDGYYRESGCIRGRKREHELKHVPEDEKNRIAGKLNRAGILSVSRVDREGFAAAVVARLCERFMTSSVFKEYLRREKRFRTNRKKKAKNAGI